MAILYVTEEAKAAIDTFARRTARPKALIVDWMVDHFLVHGPSPRALKKAPIGAGFDAADPPRNPFSTEGAPRMKD